MKNPGIQPNHFQASQAHQASQAAQRAGSNNPLSMPHGGGVVNASPGQSHQMGQVASYFTVNPNNVQIGQPTDQAKAAAAFDFLKRILRGEATAPIDKLRELGILYEYLKKNLDEDKDDNPEENGQDFQGLFDILDWFWKSRVYYGKRRY